MYIKDTLPQLVNHKKTISDKNKSFQKCDKASANLEKALEYLKRAYDLKISQSIAYV